MQIGRYLILLLMILQLSCIGQPTSKISGVSFVASRDSISDSHIMPVVNLSANYAAIMPYGFFRDISNPEIIYNTDRQWFGESRQGVKQYIEALKNRGIKIMMKPHIWIGRGDFTGHVEMSSEEKWKQFEVSYSKYILDFAKLAEETNSEILCIGTELEKFIENRPEFWLGLISEIRTIYKGKLTYAANWDEFKRTPFWSNLDYIGIDAYFPVSDMQTPTIEDSKKGWIEHEKLIKEISAKHDRPILFTEFGYRSVDYTGKEPWKSDRSMKSINMDAQVNATQALFETFWDKDWFAGGFIWKWFRNHEKSGGASNNQFTPQNKPVEKIIQAYYSKQ
jgi:hypothetical protein